jgi:uncharacterized protein (TIGR03000 family)
MRQGIDQRLAALARHLRRVGLALLGAASLGMLAPQLAQAFDHEPKHWEPLPCHRNRWEPFPCYLKFGGYPGAHFDCGGFYDPGFNCQDGEAGQRGQGGGEGEGIGCANRGLGYGGCTYEGITMGCAGYQTGIESGGCAACGKRGKDSSGKDSNGPAPQKALKPEPGPALVPPDAAVMDVRVPTTAVVYVNGVRTTMTGQARRFVSRGLEPHKFYTYELRAEVKLNGKMLDATKVVTVKAGEPIPVSFDFNKTTEKSQTAQAAGGKVRTSLILHVPTDAKVYLDGQPTRLEGSTRTFTTQAWQAGDRVPDYAIRVEVARNGQVLTREPKVSLTAGESRELVVDFNAPDVRVQASIKAGQ